MTARPVALLPYWRPPPLQRDKDLPPSLKLTSRGRNSGLHLHVDLGKPYAECLSRKWKFIAPRRKSTLA
jgi:hypothetical protein